MNNLRCRMLFVYVLPLRIHLQELNRIIRYMFWLSMKFYFFFHGEFFLLKSLTFRCKKRSILRTYICNKNSLITVKSKQSAGGINIVKVLTQ